MNILLLTLAPLDGQAAPWPIHAAPAFRRAGHTVFVAAPLLAGPRTVRAATGAHVLLPLAPAVPGRLGGLLLNLPRVALWSRRWQPEIYLADGGLAATLAHGGRGATGGYGLSLLYLENLSGLRKEGRAGWRLARRAVHEADRLLCHGQEQAAALLRCYGARGGDLTVLGGSDPEDLVALCERLLAEPPGFQ